MTNQELFNRMYNHVVQQGEPSRAVHGGCRYRYQKGSKTLMCAVGCLINDDVYTPALENKLTYSPPVVAALELSIPDLTDQMLQMARAMQNAHDDAALETCDNEEFLRCFKESAAYMANRFDLTVPHTQPNPQPELELEPA